MPAPTGRFELEALKRTVRTSAPAEDFRQAAINLGAPSSLYLVPLAQACEDMIS
jgi:hypothetical protein